MRGPVGTANYVAIGTAAIVNAFALPQHTWLDADLAGVSPGVGRWEAQ